MLQERLTREQATRTRRSVRVGMVVSGLAVAVLVGVAVVAAPRALTLLVLCVCAGSLLVSPQIRVAFVVLGALVAFQSAESVNTMKLVYLVGLLLCVVAAALELRRPPPSALPLLAASAILGGVVAVSAVVSLQHGTSSLDWFRDAAPYLLFAVCPLLALDAARCSRAYRVAVLLLAGIVATLSFTFEWMDRHALAGPLPHLGLPTFLLPGALFSFTTAGAMHWSRYRRAALSLSGAVLVLVLIAGSRSGLLFVTALVAIHATSGRWLLSRISSPLAILALSASLILVLLSCSRVLGIDAGNLVARMQATVVVINDPTTDPSYRDRGAQTRSALEGFRSSPIVGVGPGFPFEWVDVSGRARRTSTIDSPMAYAAKFGLLGILAMAAIIAGFVWLLRSSPAAAELRASRSALLGYVTIVVAWMASNSPLEDKGAFLGALLLLALNWDPVPQSIDTTI